MTEFPEVNSIRMLKSAGWAILTAAFLCACTERAPTDFSRNNGTEPESNNNMDIPALLAGPLVFHGAIDRVIHRRCSPCHRPGESAPFDLLTFEDLGKRLDFIRDVIQSNYMPPWLPDSTDIPFADSRQLTRKEKSAILDWIESGAPEGSPSNATPEPDWPEGWQLGEPDRIVEMPRDYNLPAEGMDVYRNFVIPMPTDQLRFVRAVEFKPGNPRIVHHAVMFIDRTDSSKNREALESEVGFGGSMDTGEARLPDGFFLGWTPGKTPFHGYDKMAWALTPGTDMVLQMHMRPTGKRESIRARIGLYFSEKPPEQYPYALVVREKFIDIPAGASDYLISKSFTLPIPVTALSIYPHAHYLGTQLEASARLPEGHHIQLLKVPNWDFNWQDQYRFQNPVRLPAGTVLEMNYHFDNSADNPANLFDPPQRIRYGQNSTDEMAELMLQVVPDSIEDLNTLRRQIAEQALMTDIKVNERRLESEPDDTGLRVYLARRYLRIGDIVNAEDMFRSVLNPAYNAPSGNVVIAQHELGLLSLERKNPGKALEFFLSALETHRTLGIAHNTAVEHYYIGNAYLLSSNIEKARSHYRSAMELNPDDPDYCVAFIELHEDYTGRDQDLIREVLQLAGTAAEQTGYSDPQVLHSLSLALLLNGEIARASDTARKAMELAVASGNRNLANHISQRLNRIKQARP